MKFCQPLAAAVICSILLGAGCSKRIQIKQLQTGEVPPCNLQPPGNVPVNGPIINGASAVEGKLVIYGSGLDRNFVVIIDNQTYDIEAKAELDEHSRLEMNLPRYRGPRTLPAAVLLQLGTKGLVTKSNQCTLDYPGPGNVEWVMTSGGLTHRGEVVFAQFMFAGAATAFQETWASVGADATTLGWFRRALQRLVFAGATLQVTGRKGIGVGAGIGLSLPGGARFFIVRGIAPGERANVTLGLARRIGKD